MVKPKFNAKDGQCLTCGNQTHSVAKKNIFNRSAPTPLTIDGVVFRGRCLLCNPIHPNVYNNIKDLRENAPDGIEARQSKPHNWASVPAIGPQCFNVANSCSGTPAEWDGREQELCDSSRPRPAPVNILPQTCVRPVSPTMGFSPLRHFDAPRSHQTAPPRHSDMLISQQVSSPQNFGGPSRPTMQQGTPAEWYEERQQQYCHSSREAPSFSPETRDFSSSISEATSTQRRTPVGWHEGNHHHTPPLPPNKYDYPPSRFDATSTPQDIPVEWDRVRQHQEPPFSSGMHVSSDHRYDVTENQRGTPVGWQGREHPQQYYSSREPPPDLYETTTFSSTRPSVPPPKHNMSPKKYNRGSQYLPPERRHSPDKYNTPVRVQLSRRHRSPERR
mmetsp:Transcript_23346/g.53290  ORF Transcript_23346/g.53290 Transcript_23346/m.53290 type:complete len:388 (-) Transcript_23346:357-1520(-)